MQFAEITCERINATSLSLVDARDQAGDAKTTRTEAKKLLEDCQDALFETTEHAREEHEGHQYPEETCAALDELVVDLHKARDAFELADRENSQKQRTVKKLIEALEQTIADAREGNLFETPKKGAKSGEAWKSVLLADVAPDHDGALSELAAHVDHLTIGEYINMEHYNLIDQGELTVSVQGPLAARIKDYLDTTGRGKEFMVPIQLTPETKGSKKKGSKKKSTRRSRDWPNTAMTAEDIAPFVPSNVRKGVIEEQIDKMIAEQVESPKDFIDALDEYSRNKALKDSKDFLCWPIAPATHWCFLAICEFIAKAIPTTRPVTPSEAYLVSLIERIELESPIGRAIFNGAGNLIDAGSRSYELEKPVQKKKAGSKRTTKKKAG